MTEIEQKPGFLEDNTGKLSTMRLMSIASLIASIVFGFFSILHEGAKNSENSLFITVAFLIAAFAPKALQKLAESKFPQLK
jgi:hypothetical protein